MRLPWRWLHSRPLLAFVVLANALLTLTFIIWPKTRITQSNFAKIQVGMSRADVYGLLGTPELESPELGLVESSEIYTVNYSQSEEEGIRRGFRHYQREQWTSSEISIIVISDTEGQVVCRYCGDGQRRDWLAYLRSLRFW